MEEKKPSTFSIRFKMLWGIGSLGTNIISNSYAALLIIFFQDYLGLSSELMALSALIYAIWNAFNDPLFGFLSDSSKSKKGRRIPFMKFSAPFLGLFFIGIWLVPTTWSPNALFWWMLAGMFLYDTAYTIIGLVYSALLPELTESDSERGSLQTYSSIFALLGSIIGFLVPDFLRPGVGETNLLPLYLGVGAIGIAGTAFILITSFSVKERPEFTQVDEPLGLVDSIRFTFKSKSFIVLVAANFMSILMQSLVLGSMFYLSDYVLKISSSMMLLIPFFVGIIIGTLIANLIAKKIGVVRAQQLLLLIAGIFLCSIFFIPNQMIYVAMFIAGFGLSGPLVLTNIMFAQVADEDEIRSGVRREAMFFGTNALITKPAQSIAIAIVPWILGLTSFISRAENGGEIFLNQGEDALRGIKIFTGLIPGIAMLLGALILFAYPLHGDYLQEVQDKVLEMHAEKKNKLKST
ncbi:MFS transporter [Promethearchaeum syntrophicum]|uniref:MFS transporter n=1 Tax=Promethearchaeum syntrophicum TaxID=2594042 RepID=A0A5B9DAT9_9ARCH|nr:MFS transporter [Candidatus Prometheoarchaeum syntrophicum]QEE15890.1 putative symporter YagG [Candidatus Prometheoarchaeum syntrophicum]